MKGFMIVAVMNLLLIAIPSISYSAPLEGSYRCEAQDPFLNKSYKGTVTIKKSHQTYSLEMNYDIGEKYKGTGILSGNLLSIVFQDTVNPENIGVVQFYKLSDDNKVLEGHWTYLGKDKTGTETCTRN